MTGVGSEYDAALRQRGSLTVWVTNEGIAAWQAEPRTTRGGHLALDICIAQIDRAAELRPAQEQAAGPDAQPLSIDRATRHDSARYLCLPFLARRLRRPLCAYEFALTPQEILARMWLHDPDLRLTRAQRRRLLRCAELRRPLGRWQQDLARIGRHYPLQMH